MPQNDAFLQQLRATFMVEAQEHVQVMSSGLLQLEKVAEPSAQRLIVDGIFRAAHSLKGAARVVELAEIETLCQSLEDIFAAWRKVRISTWPGMMDALYRALDAIGGMLATLAAAPATAAFPDMTLLRRELRRLSASAPPSSALPFPSASSAQPAPIPAPVRVQEAAPEPPEEKSLPAATVDPTRAPIPAPALHANAAENTVRVALPKLESHLLEAEELLMAKLTAGQRVADLRELTEWFDTWRRAWAAVEPDAQVLRQTQATTMSAAQPLASEMARILDFCSWSEDSIRAIEGRAATIGRVARQDHDVVSKRIDDLLENAKKLLLLPFATISTSFPRLVRDLCRDQGKKADLVIHGEQIEMDKRILEEMKDPLVHMLRNAVDHAVELPAVRAERGKPAGATITLTVSQLDGNKIQLLLSDDGAGIDGNRVKAEAIKLDLITAEEAASLDEPAAQALVFRSEVSTSANVTRLSGRGLGLAIVRENAEKLGGEVFVSSERGSGTTFRIVLPATRATFRGVLFEAAGRLLLMPTALVERVARVRRDDIRTVEGRETISLGARATALVRLADALDLPGQRSDASSDDVQVIVVNGGGQGLAFAVDNVVGEQEVLVKPLRKPLVRVRNIAAVAVLESGQIVPILNIADLLKSARGVAGNTARVAAAAKPALAVSRSILVAEDSITSRMLLKTILESAGYRVRTAVDGLDAFTQLRAEPFDLLVSDVEMPRLDGFDLTARVRADEKLAELPVVLVTARENREDRERGIEVGASAYIVKGSFDQGNLIEAVGRLIS